MSSQTAADQAKLVVNEERCKGCGLCVLACPRDLLIISDRLNEQGYPIAEITDMEQCTSCAMCSKMCPDVAIEVWR